MKLSSLVSFLSAFLFFSSTLDCQPQAPKSLWAIILVIIPFYKFCISLDFPVYMDHWCPSVLILFCFFFFSWFFFLVFPTIALLLFFNRWSFPAGLTVTIKNYLRSNVYPVMCLLYHAVKPCSWDWSKSDVIQPSSVGFHLLIFLSHVNQLAKLWNKNSWIAANILASVNRLNSCQPVFPIPGEEKKNPE